MKIGVVLTDLDGTLLEPDGSLRNEARTTLAFLAERGVPICPVTSKTPAEIGVILADLELHFPAGFENGAGVRLADGSVELSPAAVSATALRRVVAHLREVTGVPVRTIEELDDIELGELTGLSGGAIVRARQRRATLPLVVAKRYDAKLSRALPAAPRLRLIRGNRFLHLQGAHGKGDVVPRILGVVGAVGASVACGDAPNDLELLAAASVQVIVPGRRGPHPALLRHFPNAIVAPLPHGRGWARAMRDLIEAV